MRFGHLYLLSSWLCFSSFAIAGTVAAFTFTAVADSTLAGSITFNINNDSTAGLGNVIAANASYTPAVYFTGTDTSVDVPRQITDLVTSPVSTFTLNRTDAPV